MGFLILVQWELASWMLIGQAPYSFLLFIDALYLGRYGYFMTMLKQYTYDVLS